MNEKVFISYKSDEFDIANKVRIFLENSDLSCWMAPMSIKGGCSYAVEIPRAIHDCKVFVLILSNHAQNSIWVPKELDQAINAKKKIIPIAIEDFKLNNEFDFYLSNIQRYAVYEQFEDKLIDILYDIKEYLDNSTDSEDYSVYSTSKVESSDDAEIDFFGNIYKGSIVDGMPHGNGIMNYIDGTVYSGEWKNGRICGEGKLISTNGTYEGEFENDTFHGIGTFTFPDGNIYYGQWDCGVATGMGKLTMADGTIYSGAFAEGKPNGRGVEILPDGGKYIGEFINGEKEGIGEYTSADGTRLKGMWNNGKLNGKGEIIDSKGGKMQGEWMKGALLSFSFEDNAGTKGNFVAEIDITTNMPTDKGTMTYEDQTQIIGTFKNFVPNGPGEKKLPNGAIYEGIFTNGILVGPGTIKGNGNIYYVTWENGDIGSYGKTVFPDGTVFEGEWINLIPNGKGVQSGKNEEKNWDYDGYFKDGKYDGYGKLTVDDGQCYEGEWENGKRQGKGKFTYADGTSYEGEWKSDLKHGNGILTTKDDIFDGVWEKDEFISGKRIIFSDGEKMIMTGNFENDFPIGEVSINLPDGNTFIGAVDWEAGKFNGTFTYSDGSVYTGELLNGKKSGKGKLVSKGIISEGEWQNDLLHGRGRRYSSESFEPSHGIIWFEDSGLFENDAFISGTYKARYDDEAYFEGDWTDGCINGYGKGIYPDGSYYEGEWKNDFPNGIGKRYDKNGNLKYSGNFVNEKREGFGTFFYSNGDRYEGEWIAGDPYGKGTYYYNNGNSWTGTWNKDTKVSGNGYIYFNDGSYYCGNLNNELFDGNGVFVTSDGCKFEGSFIKGQRHGKFIYTNAEGEKFKCKFRKDELIESSFKKIN